MKHYTLAFLGLAATSVCADMIDGYEVFNGRKVVPLTMRGIVEPGGTEQVFNGTIQQIDAQIRNISPNFSWKDFQPSVRSLPRPRRKRSGDVKVLCHVQNLRSAPRNDIVAIQNWLNDENQATELPVSGQSCTKFSCQGNAAFWFCNDNLGWIQKPTLTLGELLNEIVEDKECQDPGNSDFIQGQAFSQGGSYNVIVNWDVCSQ
ncbi:hypothetical protein F5Y13DRAFT_195841 [Hypoxylon sp. FL1857]|nr:hypothetical protein F5Y13DRAFT_195841 [Hypoxylon sp. FL1857]